MREAEDGAHRDLRMHFLASRVASDVKEARFSFLFRARKRLAEFSKKMDYTPDRTGKPSEIISN